LSLIASAMALAPMLGPMLGGILDVTMGWRSVFALYALLGGALLVLVWVDAYSTRSRTPFRSDGGRHSAVMADTVPD
jgi:MFS family permease